MKLTWMVVPVALAVLSPGASPWGWGQSSTSGSSGQTPKKSTSAQSAALTPQEKEAQKHYRIALEAIKNNDFSTGAEELKSAAGLAPKNALIWYNLAVVESKKGDSTSALEHVQRAESLGLPKNLQNDADQLEAKLSYDVKREAKNEAFSAKLAELQRQINAGAAFSAEDHCILGSGGQSYKFELQVLNPFSSSVLLKMTSNSCGGNGCDPKYPNLQFDREIENIDAALDLANFSPDPKIIDTVDNTCGPLDNSRTFPKKYVIVIMTESGKSLHLHGIRHVNLTGVTHDEPLEGDATALRVSFPRRETAESTLNTLRDAILMSKELH